MVAGSWPSGNRGKSVHKRILGMVYVHIGRWMCTWMRYDVGISAWMRNQKRTNDGVPIPMVKEMLPESMVNKQEHFIYCSFFPSSITSFAPSSSRFIILLRRHFTRLSSLPYPPEKWDLFLFHSPPDPTSEISSESLPLLPGIMSLHTRYSHQCDL